MKPEREQHKIRVQWLPKFDGHIHYCRDLGGLVSLGGALTTKHFESMCGEVTSQKAADNHVAFVPIEGIYVALIVGEEIKYGSVVGIRFVEQDGTVEEVKVPGENIGDAVKLKQFVLDNSQGTSKRVIVVYEDGSQHLIT